MGVGNPLGVTATRPDEIPIGIQPGVIFGAFFKIVPSLYAGGESEIAFPPAGGPYVGGSQVMWAFGDYFSLIRVKIGGMFQIVNDPQGPGPATYYWVQAGMIVHSVAVSTYGWIIDHSSGKTVLLGVGVAIGLEFDPISLFTIAPSRTRSFSVFSDQPEAFSRM